MRLPLFVYALRPGDIAGIVFGVLLIAFVLVLFASRPGLFGPRPDGWKLGPGWSCQSVGKGEPVCIKDVPKAPKN